MQTCLLEGNHPLSRRHYPRRPSSYGYVWPWNNEIATEDTKQVWYADDASARGDLNSLRNWWDKLSLIGPGYGYFANSNKTCLVVKEDHFKSASKIFEGTNIKITFEGRNSNRLMLLLHTDFKTIGASSNVHCHKDIHHLLQPLEDVISTRLLPSLTGRDTPNELERQLIALPAHLGGLGITNPAAPSDPFDQSKRLTAPIIDLIVQQDEELGDALEIQQHTKSLIRSDRKKQQKITATNLKSLLPTNLKQVSELASKRGASNWLTVLPLKDHGFNLHKGAFRDALCL